MQTNLKKSSIGSPPGLITSLRGGFDTVARHIALVIFPLVVDLFLWCGPHLKMTRLIQSVSDTFLRFPGSDNPETAQFIQVSREMWQWIGIRLNLFISLRTYPVGVPSLMASRLPVQVPPGLQSITWEITNPFVVIISWLLLSVFGIGLGTLYFYTVSGAATHRTDKIPVLFQNWPRQLFQVLWLTLIWVLLIFMVSLPASCIISLLALGSPSLGQMAMLLYGGAVVWLLFPMLFSPHGIFINRQNVFESLKRGVRITRMTLPTTGLLFLTILIISQGLDLLWGSPAEASWFSLIGIAGHAFVTTGLLATSFVYYEKADQWSQKLLTQQIAPPAVQNKVP